MPSVPIPQPIYLADINNNPYLLTVNSGATLPVANAVTTIPAGANPVDWILINDSVSGITYRLVVEPSVLNPGGSAGTIEIDQTVASSAPVQILVSAPNGVVYAIQVASGTLGVALPIGGCQTTLSTLGVNVQNRLEEAVGSPGVFWNLSFEDYTALVEAMNDLLLLVGRPTQTVDVPFTLAANSVWQYVPRGVLMITDITGAQTNLKKISLFDQDYSQSAWDSSWECDTSAIGPVRWFPIGLSMFGVHPAPIVPQQVTITGLAYPVAETTFPYTGNEQVPFHSEFHVALESYASHVLRLKEGSSDFSESMSLYASYLQLAERLSVIEDRRDPTIFARSFGALMGPNKLVSR